MFCLGKINTHTQFCLLFSEFLDFLKAGLRAPGKESGMSIAAQDQKLKEVQGRVGNMTFFLIAVLTIYHNVLSHLDFPGDSVIKNPLTLQETQETGV